MTQLKTSLLCDLFYFIAAHEQLRALK